MNKYQEVVPYFLNWYDYNARILPWREDPRPYHVWVSEIMLQQTRVEAVRTYYERFLRELPTISSLAEVEEDKLLKLWEGLGYYSRVRNLQKAAKVLCENYGGELPADYEALQKLPGIGTYTAGAIASIAYHLPVPAVDGNVLRVMSRVLGSREDITKEVVKKEMTAHLLEVMPEERPGDFNQALMDIGATVCIPNGNPHCEDCPVMHLCSAFAEGTTKEIPYRPPKKERRVEKHTVFVIEYNGTFLLHRRPEKGLLAGMWELPLVDGKLTKANALQWAEEWLSRSSGETVYLPDKAIKTLPKAKHIFSHIEWEMTGYRVNLAKAPQELAKDELLVTVEELDETYSLPSAYAAYLKEIKK